MPSLSIYGRKVISPFGLLGTDENALSFGLGYTLQNSPRLLQWLLRKIGVEGTRHSTHKHAEILLQRRRSDSPEFGITDIEILFHPDFHVIIEAKVGLSLPSKSQCMKYLEALKNVEARQKKLVLLVQASDLHEIEGYSTNDPDFAKHVVCLNWTDLLPELTRLLTRTRRSQEVPSSSSESEWVRSFYNFLDKEYRMKSFSTEVWILPISTKPLWNNGISLWDIHQKYRVIWDSLQPTVRPLYLGFRVDGKVDAIHRVVKVDHDVSILEVVPEFSKLKEPWVRRAMTIWYFDEPVKLPNPVRTGSGMYNRRLRCDLDLLLSCETMVEIEAKMKIRREGIPDVI